MVWNNGSSGSYEHQTRLPHQQVAAAPRRWRRPHGSHGPNRQLVLPLVHRSAAWTSARLHTRSLSAVCLPGARRAPRPHAAQTAPAAAAAAAAPCKDDCCCRRLRCAPHAAPPPQSSGVPPMAQQQQQQLRRRAVRLQAQAPMRLRAQGGKPCLHARLSRLVLNSLLHKLEDELHLLHVLPDVFTSPAR